jgi:FAD/FMN-containing dehydrogenase
MPTWNNWSGRHKSRPDSLHFIRSEADACALAELARDHNKTLRVAGSGHSHSQLVPNDSIVADTSGLSGVISVEQNNKTAWVWAGSKIYSLGRPLHDAGLALKNQGDIDRQAIAGACSTGTHGTGKDLQNLSAAVLGFTLATADGKLLTCDASQNSEVWHAGRLSLGAFGILTRLKLQLTGAYKLKESGFQASYDEVYGRLSELIDSNERFEFFWYPQSDQATVKVINRTDTDPEYPLADEGSRVAWNYEVLPSHRPHFHTEMEYSIPEEHGPECFARIRDLLREEYPDVAWPVEYRTVAADDVWLSMAYGRATVTISVHQDVRLDEVAYYAACERIFREYDGRPHWGKVNYLDGESHARIHPRWHEWWQVRDQIDPNETFLNDYLNSLSPRT